MKNLAALAAAALSLLLSTAPRASAQVILPSGEVMTICRVWDLTDMLAISAAGEISALQAGAWSVAATQSGTWNIGTVSTVSSVTTVSALTSITNALPAGNNNIGDVDIASAPSLTIGTFPDNEPFDLNRVAGTAVSTHDSNALENPLLASGYAETPEDSDGNTSGNRVSADGDKTRIAVNRYGVVGDPCGANPYRWWYHENSSSALTDTTVHGSCGSGLYNYICSITASTGAATAWNLLIEDSTTTTILGPYYLEATAGRGFSIVFPGGRKQTNSATLISVTTSAAIAHSIDVTGYCAP